MSYALTPTYGPRNDVTCVPGCPTADGFKLGIFTLWDPTEPGGTITLNVGGATYISGIDFTLTPRGTDHPTLGPCMFSGVLLLTGLQPWTRYTWTIEQWGITDSGSGKTAPRKSDTFRVENAGCDNSGIFTHDVTTEYLWAVTGYWQHMKVTAQDGNTAAVVFVDDYGYVDTMGIADVRFATSTYLVATGYPQQTRKEYDYYLAYAAILGMLGPEEVIPYTDIFIYADFNLLAKAETMFGREVNRAWCRKNINLLPQVGDHEYISDLGWDDNAKTYPNPRWHNAVTPGAGHKAWLGTLGMLQPAPIAGATDTTANHWVTELGNLTIATMDPISNSSASGITAGLPNYTQVTTLFGTPQIVDVLNEVQRLKNPYVLFGLQHSIRYLAADGNVTSEQNFGAQHPLFNHVLTEYQRLFTQTGQTPKSLMDSPYTNGVYGTLICVHSDHHTGQCIRWHKDAYANNAAENFYSVQFGTINGSQNFSSYALTGDTVADGAVEYAQAYGATQYDRHWFHGAQLVVSPQMCYARLANWHDSTVWEKEFYRGRGNSGLAVGAVLSTPQPPSAASESL